jgi:hypothetical protein
VAAVMMVLRARLRARRRSCLALVVLVALATGLVVGAADAARRTEAAYPAYVAVHGYDAALYAATPLPGVAKLPEVASSTQVRVLASGTPRCGSCTRPINPSTFGVFGVSPAQLPHMVKLLSGHMPDQQDPRQVLASFDLAQDGVGVGTVIDVPFASSEQRDDVLNNANFTPDGPTVALRVVGIEAAEVEFPATGPANDDLYTTAAFARAYDPRIASLDAYFVNLRHGSADLPRFDAQEKALGGLSFTDEDEIATVITDSIDPQAVGWWILAGLGGLVAMVVVAQALARQTVLEAEADDALRALGVTRGQLVGTSIARSFVVAVAGRSGECSWHSGFRPSSQWVKLDWLTSRPVSPSTRRCSSLERSLQSWWFSHSACGRLSPRRGRDSGGRTLSAEGLLGWSVGSPPSALRRAFSSGCVTRSSAAAVAIRFQSFQLCSGRSWLCWCSARRSPLVPASLISPVHPSFTATRSPPGSPQTPPATRGRARRCWPTSNGRPVSQRSLLG